MASSTTAPLSPLTPLTPHLSLASVLTLKQILVACVRAKDGYETDVDCGGSHCDACADGGSCLGDSDCASGQCETDGLGGLECTSCFNGETDGLETGVDCGGTTCAARCGIGGVCASDSDCGTGKCDPDVDVLTVGAISASIALGATITQDTSGITGTLAVAAASGATTLYVTGASGSFTT
eukprot:SAG11_NODE_4492_length_1875_cov_4.160473_2_plen_180_part_01